MPTPVRRRPGSQATGLVAWNSATSRLKLPSGSMLKCRATFPDVAFWSARMASTWMGGVRYSGPLGRGLGHRVQHLRREIAGDHLPAMRRHGEADVAGTAAEIQHTGLGLIVYESG